MWLTIEAASGYSYKSSNHNGGRNRLGRSEKMRARNLVGKVVYIKTGVEAGCFDCESGVVIAQYSHGADHHEFIVALGWYTLETALSNHAGGASFIRSDFTVPRAQGFDSYGNRSGK